MSEIQDLQDWLLTNMRGEISRRDPDLLRDVEASPPQSPGERERLRERLTFRPLEPWNAALGSLTSLKLGLLDLDFAMESLRAAPDGRSEYFFRERIPAIAWSCLERLEDLAKRMSRGARPLVSKSVGDALISDLKKARETTPLDPLRHSGTHGPQRGIGRGGWIDAAKDQRYWELMALVGEDGSDVVAALQETNDAQRDWRYDTLKPFAEEVESLINRRLRRLLDAAERQFN